MKKSLLPLLAITVFAPFAGAANPVKKAARNNPALARTWVDNAKSYEGKKVTTSVIEFGDLGAVSSDAPYAVLPITTGTPGGEAGDTIPVLVPTSQIQGFINSIKPRQIGKAGSFGAKIQYASISGTFATLQGEPALVIGELNDAVKAIKPSKLLASQHEADSAGVEKTTETPTPAKPDKKKKK